MQEELDVLSQQIHQISSLGIQRFFSRIHAFEKQINVFCETSFHDLSSSDRTYFWEQESRYNKLVTKARSIFTQFDSSSVSAPNR